jgi:hypothetical protein
VPEEPVPPTPIETWYNGYRFRSRTEARWAVFFDALAVPFSYEQEGFDLWGSWYLPDFWLPEQSLWLEIKGRSPIEPEQRLAWLLARDTYRLVAIFGGDVWHTTPGHLFMPREPFHAITPCYWARCRTCGRLGLQLVITILDTRCINMGTCACCHTAGMASPGHTEQEDQHTQRLRAAFGAARQARFARPQR